MKTATQKIELVPGIKGYFVRTTFTSLRPGAFFMFDKDGDALCRFIEIRQGRVFFHVIGVNNTIGYQLNQPLDNTLIYLVKSIASDYSEGLKHEFMHEMKKRIISKLTSWEIAFVRMPDMSEISFNDLKGQQKDNPQMMEDMLGFPASNILNYL